MRTRILTGLAVSVILVALVGSCEKTKPPKPEPEGKIVFKVKPSEDTLERATKLKVYELQPVKEDRQTFEERSKQLFGGALKSDPIQANGMISLADADKPSNFMMLELGTGYLSFNRGMADQIDDKPGDLPSEDEVIKIAQDFLEKNDLGPGNPREMFSAHVGRIRSASFDPKTGNEGPVRDQMLTVYFARRLDDVTVIGSGSKMIVRIGDGGEVVGGARRWVEVGRGRTLRAEDLRSVAELLKDVEMFLTKEMDEFEQIEVVKFDLVYYDNGGKYIQPALAYEASVTGKELKHSYLGQTAILREPPERVGPEPVSAEAKRLIKRSSPDEKQPVREQD